MDIRSDVINEANHLGVWILPAVYATGGILLGFILEKSIFPIIRKFAERTKWKGDDVIVESFRGMVFFWMMFAGFYGASLHLDLRQEYLDIIRKILLVLAIFTSTVVLTRIATGLVRLQTEKVEGVIPTTSIFQNITKILCYSLGFLIILQSLGISITPILTALGVGGLAVALALQDTLSNLFAGLQITATKKVQPGDFIRLDSGDEGFVYDITWRYTTIRTQINNMVIIPNSKLASSIFTNYFAPQKEMAFSIVGLVSHNSDLNKVEQISLEVAKKVMTEVSGAVTEHEPVFRYHNYTESGIAFNVVLKATEFDKQYLLKHEFIKALNERFAKEGIEIPYPVRTVIMKDPQKTN
jgi:small-conductance mechanosensitive channel